MVYKVRDRDEHLFGPGPKRILALDGGGIRGALTLGYLELIEKILRDRTANDNFRLCDYFDLIAGTSTGSIIATGLALGFSVRDLQRMYCSLAHEVFRSSMFRRGVLNAKFPIGPLVRALEENYGDETLGSDRLQTGLLIIAKRLDTGSIWPLHNNPKGKYFNPIPDSTVIPNRDYLLRDIVRASTAAPTYFKPEKIHITKDQCGAFVDGGVSPHNNPSLQALLLTTTRGYGFNWSFGEDRLLLVSVGTGSQKLSLTPEEVLDMSAALLGVRAIRSVMDDTNWLQQAVLQWMSHSPTSWEIDTEIDTLQEDILGDGKPLISYLRYDVIFDERWVRNRLDIRMDQQKLDSLEAMDNPNNVDELAWLGTRAALVQIKLEHFPGVFDLA